MNMFKELLANRKLIWKLAKNDFKTKYSGSYFGIFWAFVQPIVTVLIYVFVFQVGFKAQPTDTGYPYVLQLVSGIIPWFFFSEALLSATNCLLEYSYLVKKVVFKISILPIVKVVSAIFVHIFFICFGVLLFVIMGKIPPIQFVQIIYYMFCTLCLAIGLSFFTCAIVPFFRDFYQMVSIALQIGMWLCPIMYDISLIPTKIQFFLKLNPVYYIVQGYRDSYMNGIWFWHHGTMGIYFWVVTILFGILGFKTFKKLRVHFSDVI